MQGKHKNILFIMRENSVFSPSIYLACVKKLFFANYKFPWQFLSFCDFFSNLLLSWLDYNLLILFFLTNIVFFLICATQMSPGEKVVCLCTKANSSTISNAQKRQVFLHNIFQNKCNSFGFAKKNLGFKGNINPCSYSLRVTKSREII